MVIQNLKKVDKTIVKIIPKNIQNNEKKFIKIEFKLSFLKNAGEI